MYDEMNKEEINCLCFYGIRYLNFVLRYWELTLTLFCRCHLFDINRGRS